MEIRNLMEELVKQAVVQISKEEKFKGGAYATPECLPDVACFVLNRIPQQYVSSSRGVAHGEKTFKNNHQLMIDIMALAHEGFKRINNVQRSYYSSKDGEHGSAQDPAPRLQGPVFVFPVIKGRFIDCGDFSAAKDVEVVLKTLDDEPVRMLDIRWQNPFYLDSKISGHYLFLPQPQSASQPGEEKLFELKLTVNAKGFDPFEHFFKLGLTAKASPDNLLSGIPDYRIEDLYLLRN